MDTKCDESHEQKLARFCVIPDATFPNATEIQAGLAPLLVKFPGAGMTARVRIEFTPLEMRFRYNSALSVAAALAQKCIRNEKGKYAHLGDGDPARRREAILYQYYWRTQLLRKDQFEGWSPRELQWIVSKCAENLDWPLPAGIEGDANEHARRFEVELGEGKFPPM